MNLGRVLGPWTTISIVVGGIIGSGIFLKPSLMASQLGSPLWLIAVWAIAGIISLFGALTNAEVATMIPETGGQYVFFQKMYGDFFAFLYGWAAFAVFNTAGVASIAYVAGTYFEYVVPLPHFPIETEQSIHISIPLIGTVYPLQNFGVKSVTILIVGALTLANYFSTRFGGKFLLTLTSLKILALAFIVIVFFQADGGDVGHLVQRSAYINPEGWAFVGAITMALSGAFWGYDGWNNITFVAGEIKDPQRNIHRGLLFGLGICILVYVVINVAYLYILPIDAMAQSPMVASEAAQLALGAGGGVLMAMMVILSSFGTTSGNILATARITFAMSREKKFFAWAGHIHPTFQTPANALILHGLWTSALVISGSFDALTDMLIFVSWFFYGMSAIGLFILRKKMKHAERPYKVWGYPYVPLSFILFTFVFLVLTLANDIYHYAEGTIPMMNSVFGLLLIAPGIPLYGYFKYGRFKKG